MLSYGTNPALNAPTEYDPERFFCGVYGSGAYPTRYTYGYTVIGEGENAQTWMARDAYYRGVSYVEYDVRDFLAHYTFENAASACPTGWHLPSEEEFNTLISVVGNARYKDATNLATGISNWKYITNQGDTTTVRDLKNPYGFSALPHGYSKKSASDGTFTTIIDRTNAYFWLSNGKRVKLYSTGFTSISYEIASTNGSNFALSVRCVKDAE